MCPLFPSIIRVIIFFSILFIKKKPKPPKSEKLNLSRTKYKKLHTFLQYAKNEDYKFSLIKFEPTIIITI